MRDADLRKLDLPLLMMFDSLLRTQSTVQTAHEMGVTQSAVSHALAKLRHIFSDPLFVRGPNGLQSTERALALAPLVHEVLELLRATLRQNRFDAAQTHALVRIALAEHALELAPPLLERLRALAPNLTIRFSPVRANFADALASREIDFAIGPSGVNDRRLANSPLWADRICALVRQDHPLAAEADPASPIYQSARHVLCNDQGGGATEASLAAIGRAEAVLVETHNYWAAFAMAARTDLVAMAPHRVALQLAPAFDLKVVPLKENYPVKVGLCARSLADRDPMQDWLSETITDIAAAM